MSKHAAPVESEALPDPAARPEAQPWDPTGIVSLSVGTVLFGLAFLGLLPFYSRLRSNDEGWVLWCALTGFGLGCLGIEVLRQRAKRISRQA